MKTIHIRNNDTYHYIKNGNKTIEGRISSSFFDTIVNNELVIFRLKRTNNFVVATIKNIRPYKNFKEMLSNENIKNILPNVLDIEKGTEIYSNYYSKDKLKKKGVVALEFKLV